MKIPTAVLEDTMGTNPLLCVSVVIIFIIIACPASQVTFGDSQSKKCVRTCPTNNGYTAGSYVPQTFYADISNRLCVLTCNASYSTGLFGSNSTRTCETKCLDYQAYSEPQSTYRICVDRCWKLPTFYYANNLTKKCGT